MTATLDSIADHRASQEISGWRPAVFVTMIRMTEKTMMITPRPSTPQRPSFWDSDIFRPKTSHIGIAMTNDTLIFRKITDGWVLTEQVCYDVHSCTISKTDQRALDVDRFLTLACRTVSFGLD